MIVKTRHVKMGKTTRLAIESVMRELRRMARERGVVPAVDTEDPDMQRAWRRLSQMIAHNGKLHRQRIARDLRPLVNAVEDAR